MYTKSNYNIPQRVRMYEVLARQDRKLVGELCDLYLKLEETRDDIERKKRQIKMLNEMQMYIVKVGKG